jgi:2,3-bisphosphoglycerate-independent phosphoglycerate mutase
MMYAGGVETRVWEGGGGDRIVIVIFDGIADRPVKELGNKTPLEVADKPNIDGVAKSGICGLMDPIAPGIRPGSAPAHLALLGYDPFAHYTGRGAFEAAGIGIKLKPSEIAFRCNFATVDETLTVVDRRAGRVTDGLTEIASTLDGMRLDSFPDVDVTFKRAIGHRALLILRGEGLSSDVSDVDPGKVGVKPLAATPTKLSPEAKKTADIVNEFVERSHRILEVHPVNVKRMKEGKPPANIILPRGAGIAPSMETLDKKYGISNSACIAEVALVKGVACYAGMKIINAPGSTAGLDTNVESMGKSAVNALRGNEFVLVNVKGGDVAGHDGNAKAKVTMIERLDSMVSLILDHVGEETLLVITSDHTTPVSVKDHTGDPVPLVVSGPGVRVDDVARFDERSVAKGGIKRIRGVDLMPILLDLSGKAKKFGA